MVKSEKLRVIQARLAAQYQIAPDAFRESENVVVPSGSIFFQVTTFGDNAVILAHPELCEWCERYLKGLEAKEILDGVTLYSIERMLRQHGKKLCGQHSCYAFVHAQWRPERPEGYEYVLIEPGNRAELWRHKGFLNALNYKDDVIGHGAFADGRLVCLAAADDRMDPMWQIGIDTVPEHRGRGLARYLVNGLAREIEQRGKLAYYTTWSANIASSLVAIQAGFEPLWLEYFAEDLAEGEE